MSNSRLLRPTRSIYTELVQADQLFNKANENLDNYFTAITTYQNILDKYIITETSTAQLQATKIHCQFYIILSKYYLSVLTCEQFVNQLIPLKETLTCLIKKNNRLKELQASDNLKLLQNYTHKRYASEPQKLRDRREHAKFILKYISNENSDIKSLFESIFNNNKEMYLTSLINNLEIDFKDISRQIDDNDNSNLKTLVKLRQLIINLKNLLPLGPDESFTQETLANQLPHTTLINPESPSNTKNTQLDAPDTGLVHKRKVDQLETTQRTPYHLKKFYGKLYEQTETVTTTSETSYFKPASPTFFTKENAKSTANEKETFKNKLQLLFEHVKAPITQSSYGEVLRIIGEFHFSRISQNNSSISTNSQQFKIAREEYFIALSLFEKSVALNPCEENKEALLNYKNQVRNQLSTFNRANAENCQTRCHHYEAKTKIDAFQFFESSITKYLDTISKHLINASDIYSKLIDQLNQAMLFSPLKPR